MKTCDLYILNLLPLRRPFAALTSDYWIIVMFFMTCLPFCVSLYWFSVCHQRLTRTGLFFQGLPFISSLFGICQLLFHQTSFSNCGLTTADSLQTAELLMRSDGQMDGHCENNYRVLCGSMYWEWRCARDIASKLNLNSHTSSRVNKEGGFVLNETSNWFFGTFLKSVTIRFM